MPLLADAFTSVLPHVICGQPVGRECATQLVSNCRGARLMGIRATWPAQRRSFTYHSDGEMCSVTTAASFLSSRMPRRSPKQPSEALARALEHEKWRVGHAFRRHAWRPPHFSSNLDTGNYHLKFSSSFLMRKSASMILEQTLIQWAQRH